MCFRLMKVSHKLRMAIVSATASGVLLAISFLLVIGYIRSSTLSTTKSELQQAMILLRQSRDLPHEIEELRDSQPNVIPAIFDLRDPSKSVGNHHSLLAESGYHWHDGIFQLGANDGDRKIVVGMDWRSNEAKLQFFSFFAIGTWILLTPMVGIVTWLAANATFRPLVRMASEADQIGETNFTKRLNATDSAEIGDFARQLNRMLDRIERTVRREEQFASDAAHELRTPLSIMRTRIEMMALSPRSAEDYVQSNAKLLDEVDRMTRIVDSLLRSARAEPGSVDPIDISPVVEQVVARWVSLGNANLQFSGERSFASIMPDEVEIVVDNLVANAIRYSTADTAIEIRCEQVGHRAQLTVQDSGPGVDPAIAQTLFERFVRADSSRNRESGGSGIGLSVCRRILESRGGSISLTQNKGNGATFVCLI